MKNLIKYFAALLLLPVCLGSCQKEEEVYPVYPAPAWQVDNAKYSVNMTAVVVLPDNLLPYFQENDQVAAFVGDECRGIGELIDNAFFVTIKGTPEEDSKVFFQYYSTRNQYMYKTDATLSFEQDVIYGTADAPEVLTLNIIQ